MTLSDFVWLAIGETLLAGTFALGILVGVSLNRKGQRNGDSNTQAGKYCDGSRGTQGIAGSTCRRRS